jgi:hypothetical protein
MGTLGLQFRVVGKHHRDRSSLMGRTSFSKSTPHKVRGYYLLVPDGTLEHYRIVGQVPEGRTALSTISEQSICSIRTELSEMPDKSITKVNAQYSPRGRLEQKYLASGIHVSIRLWENEKPNEAKPETARDYETAGFVIDGKAELTLNLRY